MLVCGSRKLRTVRFKECLVTSPIFCPPHALLAHKDRPGNNRICDGRLVECRSLGSERTGNNDPLRRIAVLEVCIRGRSGECIETQCRVAGVETGLATIAINLLRPYQGRTGPIECAIILCAALHVLSIIGSKREALELQSREPRV